MQFDTNETHDLAVPPADGAVQLGSTLSFGSVGRAAPWDYDGSPYPLRLGMGTPEIHYVSTNSNPRAESAANGVLVASVAEINGTIANGPVLADNDAFGESVATADLDGDGVPEIIAGAGSDDAGGTSRGTVHVMFMNSDGTVKRTAEINDNTANGPVLDDGANFGISVAPLGDLDGDGVPDLAAGAVGNGTVHVMFMNSDGTVKRTAEINDNTANGPSLSDNDRFGISVASPGDLDGDGVPDLAAGAHADDEGGTNRGTVHVMFMNSDGTVKRTAEINDNTANGPSLSDNDRFGISVASPGDLDGDGVPDLAAGALWDDAGGTNRGAVHVMFMNSDGTVKSTAEINDNTADGPVLDDDDRFGASVAPLGDLDGDGVPDLAAGAILDDTDGMDEGAVHVMFMNSDGTVKRTAEINANTADGPSLSSADRFGRSVASPGDLDGDGVPDLAAGAFLDDTDGTNRGAVHVVFMNSDGTVKRTAEINDNTADGPVLDDDDRFGRSVASPGDLDGDGVPDLAAGAVGDGAGGTNRGAVHVVFMNSDGTVKRTAEINDNTADGPVLDDDDFFGRSVASPGDLDGDGVPDLAAGAVGDGAGGTNRGAVHVMFMNSDGTVKSTAEINANTANGPSLSDGDRFGTSVASPGDLDGDGVPDLAAGAILDNGDGFRRGAVHVMFMNSDGTVKRTAEINDNTADGPVLDDDDQFGTSVAPLGDLDGDGVPDLAVGAGADDADGSDRGAVHVMFMNSDGTVKSTAEINGNTADGPVLDDGDRFGTSVASPGDLDGDGVPDLAAGANQDDAGGNSRGAVHVMFMNSDGTVKRTAEINGNTADGPVLDDGDRFGTSVAPLGDLDGDVVLDLAIGADRDDADGSDRGAVHVVFLGSTFADVTPPSLTAASLNEVTGILTLVFNDMIDVTPPSNVNLDRLFLSEAGYVDQIPLDGATLNTASDGVIIYVTLNATQLAEAIPLAMPQLDIAAGAISDRSGNAIAASPDNPVTVVLHANRAPVADAGPDQAVDERTVVTLDGSASSDPEGDQISYSWTAPSDITLSNASAASPTFTAPEVASDTDYTITLNVTDGTLSDTDTVTITVRHVNRAPVADAGPDQAVDERTTVTLDGSGSSDPDGNFITYSWTAPEGITLRGAVTASPTFTAPEVTSDTNYTITLGVSDNIVSATDTVTITVRHVNRAPAADAGPDQAVDERTVVTLDGSASSDLDGDTLTYSWTAPSGIALSNASAASPTFTAPEVAFDTDYTITLNVTDGTLSDTDTVTITVRHVNRAPAADAGPDQAVDERTTVTLDGSASSDPEGDQISYSWTAPSDITLSNASAASPTFTAPEVASDTDYTITLNVTDGTLHDTDTVTITVRHVNRAPAADAGPDQTVDERTTVTLNGSASSDPDGDALTYGWTAPEGITLRGASTASPTFTAPEVTSDTNYTITLGVSDNAVSATDTVTVTVRHVNRAPIADAGPDQVVDERMPVTLDGSASSDLDGDALTYNWTAPAGITLSDTAAQSPTFTAPEVASDTDYTLTLEVSDGTLSDTDTVTVTVRHVNRAPIADAGPDQAVDERTTVTLDGSSSSDPDNDALTYNWTAPAGITLSDTAAQSPTFTAPDVTSDTDYTLTLEVSDGTLSDTDTVTVTVRHVNRAPVADAGANQSASERTLVTLDGSASSDPDGDTITYSWTAPAGITLSNAAAQSPTFTAPEVASDTDYTLTLEVSDGTLSDTDTVTITVRHVNRAPVADAGANQTADERTTVTLDGSASSDPDGDALTYNWTAPAGITLSNAAAQSPTFTAPDVTSDTDYTLTLEVSDGTLSDTDTVTVTVRHVNRAPVADAGANQTADERTTVTLDGSASSDPDNDALTYNWTAPAGITLSDTAAQSPTFTAPDVTSDTDYTLTLEVSDGTLSDTDTVTVTVRHVNRAPVADAGANQSASERTLVTLDGSASSDPDGDTITYSWTAPAGITLSNAAAQSPTFTAPDVTSDTDYTLTLEVSDGTLSDTDTVTITVRHVNRAPVADAGANQTADERTTVTLDGSASSDPDGDALTYNWTAPAGITLSNAAAQSPTFTAPDVTSDTDYTLTLEVSDGTLSDTDTVTITVRHVNRAPVADAGANQTADERTTVTLDGSASSDPDNDALTYNWTAPAGITLSDTAAQSPTFTAPDVTSDTDYTLTLEVSDGTLSDTDTVTITVRHVNRAPVADAGANQTADERTTVTLDGSASSDPDNDALTYNWTAPAGITLSNAAAQSPTFTAPDVTSDTDYTLTLEVSDGSLSDTDTVTITVRHVNRAPVADAGADKAASERTLVTLDGSASSDPDGDMLTYNWTAPAGITLSDVAAQSPTFMAPEVTSDTGYTFTLNVTDGSLSDTDTVTVTVRHVNRAPVADAGANQTADERTTVTLDGSASSDPDGDALTYNWTAPAGITLSDTAAQSPTFTAPDVTSDTDYTLTLEVSDGSLSDTDTVTVTVRHVNRAPVADAGADKAASERTLVTLDGSASSDPDGDMLTYNWTAPAGITLSDAAAQSPTFMAPEVTSDTGYTFTLNVTDGSLSDTDTVTVTVRHVNRAPVADAGANQSASERTLVTLDGSASSDPDGDTITYNWTAPAGITLSDTAAQSPTFTAPDVTSDTDYTLTLEVSDGSLSDTDTVTVTVRHVNRAPVADAGADKAASERTLVTLDGSASSDPDGDMLTYNWTAPAGITLSDAAAQSPTFMAPEVTSDTGYTFTLNVTDGSLSDTDTVTVTVRHVNRAPVADAGANQSASERTLVTLDGSASSDPDGDTITYNWTAPAGITLSDTAAQSPTFTAPDVTSDTDYTLTLEVSDGTLSDTDTVTVTVRHVNRAPTADAGANQTADERTTVTLDGSASSDPDGDTITYNWTAPAGITLSDTAAQSPTFTAPDVTSDTGYTFTLNVTDGQLFDTDTVTITVREVNRAPDADAGADKAASERTTVTLDGSASSDPDGDALTYNWTAPAGITLSDTAAQSPTFTAPDVTSDTGYTFTLNVTDGQLFDTDTVTITVREVNRAPTADAGANQTADERTLVTLDGSASSDPDGDTITYSWTAPAGITLSDTAAQSPTFTAPDVTSDTGYTFTLNVTDGQLFDTDTVTITVREVNRAPTADAGANQTADERTLVTLDGSASSDPDNDALTYNWTAPAGITLSDTAAQSPTFTAPDVTSDTGYTFTLNVTDGQLFDTDTVTITVREVNRAPTADAGANQTADERTLVTLDGSASSDPDNDALTYNWTAPAGITLSDTAAQSPTFTAPDVTSDTGTLVTSPTAPYLTRTPSR